MTKENSMITYRMAAIDDIEQLTQIRVEFFADMNKNISEKEKSDIYLYNRTYFEETLKDGTFASYLAFDGDIIVGTSGISFYKTPPNPKNRSGKTAYISNMFTKPEYRGRGIATRLFDLTVAEARNRGCEKLILHATEMGRPIYKKFGFLAPDNAMEFYFEK